MAIYERLYFWCHDTPFVNEKVDEWSVARKDAKDWQSGFDAGRQGKPFIYPPDVKDLFASTPASNEAFPWAYREDKPSRLLADAPAKRLLPPVQSGVKSLQRGARNVSESRVRIAAAADLLFRHWARRPRHAL
jgi:hypothetical protein